MTVEGKLQLSIHQVSQEVVHYYKIALQAGAIRYLNLFLARKAFKTSRIGRIGMTWNFESKAVASPPTFVLLQKAG